MQDAMLFENFQAISLHIIYFSSFNGV